MGGMRRMEIVGSSLKSPCTSTPAVAVTVMWRSKLSPSPFGRSTRRCSPIATGLFTGVRPSGTPSSSHWAGGDDVITSFAVCVSALLDGLTLTLALVVVPTLVVALAAEVDDVDALSDAPGLALVVALVVVLELAGGIGVVAGPRKARAIPPS